MKILLMYLIFIGSLFGSVIKLPNIDNLQNKMNIEICKKHPSAFNDEAGICSGVILLKEMFDLDSIIETGTFKGKTTDFFADVFDIVHTYEINREYARAYKKPGNVKLFVKNSGRYLKNSFKHLNGRRPLFYLDAHWGDYWPLNDEIKQISKQYKDNCIILIDDCQVPGYPNIGHDNYKGQPLNYEYVKSRLDEAFTSYKVYYLITEGEFRGKMLIIPDSLSDGKTLTAEDFQ